MRSQKCLPDISQQTVTLNCSLKSQSRLTVQICSASLNDNKISTALLSYTRMVPDNKVCHNKAPQ